MLKIGAPNTMLCLSLLLPGKVGRVVRKILLPIFSILLLYAIIWIIIIKCVNFETRSQTIQGKSLFLVINVRNDTFASVEVRDIRLINKNGEYVRRMLHNFPVEVPGNSEKEVRVRFAIDDYKKIETTVKTLLNQFTFKSNLDGS